LEDRAIRLNLLIGCSLNRKLNDYEIILNSPFSILNFERQLEKPEFEVAKALNRLYNGGIIKFRRKLPC